MRRKLRLYQRHGMTKSIEHATWLRLRNRCNDENLPCYKNYGGKGVKVCKEWDNFETFYKDMGKRPSPNHSIDRLDSNKGYCKSNCRWATRIEQNRNTSRNRLVTYEGKTQCLAAWTEELGLSKNRLVTLLNRGRSVEEAFRRIEMTKKFETRGGARQKKRLYSSQARLLQVTWNQFGGVTACAEKIGVSRQLLINWKLDGRVPLEWCGRVARALGISLYSLNYEGIVDLLGETTPTSWKDVVKMEIKDSDKVDYVLNGNHPDKAKEILCAG